MGRRENKGMGNGKSKSRPAISKAGQTPGQGDRIICRVLEQIPGHNRGIYPVPGKARHSDGKISKKKSLFPVAEAPDVEMVLVKDLTGRAVAVDLFNVFRTGCPACAEEGLWLGFPEGIMLVGRAGPAILQADLPVLDCILDFYFPVFHREGIV